MCSTSSHQSIAISSGIGINEDGISDADLLSCFADQSSGNGHGHGIGINEDGISDADLLSFFEDKSSGIGDKEKVDDPPSHLPLKNEKRKMKKAKTSKSRIRASSSKAGHSSGIKIPKVDASPYFARLPAELRDKIFNELVNDHDSFQAMASISKQMYQIVGPYLQEKRKKIFDELCTNSEVIVRCRHLLDKEEKFLKRVLRTNEELTCRAHNLPIGENGEGKRPKNAFFVLGMLGIEAGKQKQDQLPSTLQVLELARMHCHKFGRHIDNKLDMDSKIDEVAEKHHLSEASAEELEAAFARHLLKNFLYRYPMLSVFTDVYWPDQMPEQTRRQMAMEYAKEQTKMGPKKRRYIRQNRGRMYDMCTKGWVEGPPQMTKRARMHEAEVYHPDDYMTFYEFMNGGWRNYPNLPRDDYYEDEMDMYLDMDMFWGMI